MSTSVKARTGRALQCVQYFMEPVNDTSSIDVSINNKSIKIGFIWKDLIVWLPKLCNITETAKDQIYLVKSNFKRVVEKIVDAIICDNKPMEWEVSVLRRFLILPRLKEQKQNLRFLNRKQFMINCFENMTTLFLKWRHKTTLMTGNMNHDIKLFQNTNLISIFKKKSTTNKGFS